MKCMKLLSLSLLLISFGSAFAMNDEPIIFDMPESPAEIKVDLTGNTDEILCETELVNDEDEHLDSPSSLGFFKTAKKMFKSIGLKGAAGTGAVLLGAGTLAAYKYNDAFRQQIDAILKKIKKNKKAALATTGGALLACGLTGYKLGFFSSTEEKTR